jgi:hypothetical protein
VRERTAAKKDDQRARRNAQHFAFAIDLDGWMALFSGHDRLEDFQSAVGFHKRLFQKLRLRIAGVVRHRRLGAPRELSTAETSARAFELLSNPVRIRGERLAFQNRSSKIVGDLGAIGMCSDLDCDGPAPVDDRFV